MYASGLSIGDSHSVNVSLVSGRIDDHRQVADRPMEEAG